MKAQTKARINVTILLLLLLNVFGNSYAASNKEEYELQEKCGKSAEEFSRQKFGFMVQDTDKFNQTTSQTNHYNKKLNKCYVLIALVTYHKDSPNVDPKDYRVKGPDFTFIVYDLHENHELGRFIHNTNDFLQQNLTCILPDKPIARCSTNEWDSFLKPYMEE